MTTFCIQLLDGKDMGRLRAERLKNLSPDIRVGAYVQSFMRVSTLPPAVAAAATAAAPEAAATAATTAAARTTLLRTRLANF